MFILNRVPTKPLKNRTPYETWKGYTPNLNHLRVFGCRGYMKTPPVNLKKLDDQSKQVVYLGTEPSNKAYRLYDPDQNRVYVSRDVEFDEAKGYNWADYMKDVDLESKPEWVNFRVQQEDDQNTISDPDQNDMPSPNVNPNKNSDSDQFDETDVDSPNPTAVDRRPRVRGKNESSQNFIYREPNPDYNLAGPSQPDHDTFDDTPSRGFKPTGAVYTESAPIEQLAVEEVLLIDEEPRNHSEAIGIKEWEAAMKSEIASIE